MLKSERDTESVIHFLPQSNIIAVIYCPRPCKIWQEHCRRQSHNCYHKNTKIYSQ